MKEERILKRTVKGGERRAHKLVRKRVWNSPAHIKYHYEDRYVLISPKKRGRKNSLAGLTADQIKKINAWKAGGVPVKKIHESVRFWGYDVSERTVRRFLK